MNPIAPTPKPLISPATALEKLEERYRIIQLCQQTTEKAIDMAIAARKTP